MSMHTNCLSEGSHACWRTSLRNRTRTVLSGFLSVAAAAAVTVSLPAPAKADTWKQLGNWNVIGSPELGGCTMATQYTSGAHLFVAATPSGDGSPKWEITVSDRSWNVIDANRVYPIDIHVLGSELVPRRLEMQGHRSGNTTGLFVSFSDGSEEFEFMSAGMSAGSHLAFVFEGRLMGAYSISGAGPAYEELANCYDHFSQRQLF